MLAAYCVVLQDNQATLAVNMCASLALTFAALPAGGMLCPSQNGQQRRISVTAF